VFWRARKGARDKLMRAVSEAVAGDFAQLQAQVVALEVELRASERRRRRDLDHAADVAAATESAAYVVEHLAEARAFHDRFDTLRYCLKEAPTGGMALEFGVFEGATLRVIAEARDGEVYGFDSFEGLPETWRPGFSTGAFAVDRLPEVPGAELVVGFLSGHPGPVDLLHVDSDLYRSAVTVLDQVSPRLRPGSIVLFDEYFNHPGWRRGEALAWQELVDRTGLTFEFLAYTADDEQVAVRVLDPPGPARTAGE
jgi:hypothetical protein